MSSKTEPADDGRAGEDPQWNEIWESREFAELRRRLRRFVFPMTVAFLVWYLTYVLLADYAHGFMSTRVVGYLNIGLVFGLLQFVSTFAITTWYVRYADAKLDPIAKRIREDARGVK